MAWGRVRGRLGIVSLVTVVALGAATTLVPADASAHVSGKVKRDPKAILRLASDLSTFGGPALDPIKTKNGNTIDFGWDFPIYDTLVHIAKDGSFQPGLAKSWEIVDAQTVKIELRSGLKFHDDTSFDAAAVKAGFERTLAANNRAMPPSFFELESVEATGTLEVTLHLREAAMDTFFPTLASIAGFIPSPKAVAAGTLSEHPVGAGPYAFDSLEREQKLSERKFRGFWDAKAYPLAGIDFVQTATGPSTVNALLADQVDLVTLSNTSDAAALEGRDGITLFRQPSPANTYLLTMCTTSPPFDDLNVRKAIAHIVDRDQINQGALDGVGFASPLPTRKGSQFYFADLAKRYPHDTKLAKKLLKKAGVTNLSFDLLEPPVPSFLKVAEVVQGQLADAGIDAKIVQSTNVVQDLFLDNKAPAAVLYTVTAGLPGILPYLSPDGLANLCHYRNPDIDAAVTDIQSALGDTAKLEAGWRKLQTVLVDDLPLVFLASPTVVLGMQDRVRGVKQVYESGSVNLEGVYIAK